MCYDPNSYFKFCPEVQITGGADGTYQTTDDYEKFHSYFSEMNNSLVSLVHTFNCGEGYTTQKYFINGSYGIKLRANLS